MNKENNVRPPIKEGWREVSKEEFAQKVFPLNVHPEILGIFPYSSLWKMPNGEVKGKIVDFEPPEQKLPLRQYLLPVETE